MRARNLSFIPLMVFVVVAATTTCGQSEPAAMPTLPEPTLTPVPPPTATPSPTATPTPKPAFSISRLGVSAENLRPHPPYQVPVGTQEVYVFFNYANAEPGLVLGISIDCESSGAASGTIDIEQGSGSEVLRFGETDDLFRVPDRCELKVLTAMEGPVATMGFIVVAPPTPTSTPGPSATPDLAAATAEAWSSLTANKRDGIYTVGVEIAPGRWESQGNEDDCYWARYDRNQNILGNHFGRAGGTVTIRETDYEVEFEDCGTWQYVENVQPVLRSDAAGPKGDGFYTVGIEIVVGRWESTGTGDDCYWARLDAYQNTLDNHFGSAGGTVTIRATDYEVTFQNCGAWEYVGP